MTSFDEDLARLKRRISMRGGRSEPSCIGSLFLKVD